MKIILLIEETSFYHPQFTYNLIKKLKNNHEIVLGGIVINKAKNNHDNYLKKNILNFKLLELFKLIYKKKKDDLLSFFFKEGFKNNFYSVESVFRKEKIDFIKIRENINDTENLKNFRKYSPDLIISSNPQFFKKELINLPKFGCINRHFSLLPKFKGLWPVFYTISNNEKYFGITIHKINEKYDDGEILFQKKFEINEKNMSKIYTQLFNDTPEIICNAIENLINLNYINSNQPNSYNSFPSKEDWKVFRKNGGTFI